MGLQEDPIKVYPERHEVQFRLEPPLQVKHGAAHNKHTTVPLS